LARKLSRRSQKRLKQMNDSLEQVVTLVNKIKPEDLEDLVHRDAISIGPDGFPASSGFGDGSSAGGWGPNSTSSTESAVIARQRRVNDELGKNLRNIEKMILQAERSLREVHRSIAYITEKAEEERGRTSASNPCAVCMVAPATKSGLCLDDYKRWEADGRPDKFLWVMYARGDRHAEGHLMVPECPPPTVKVNT